MLEMKAVLLALQAFAAHIKGHSVLIAKDNTTMAVYINRQGELSILVVEVAVWCTKNMVLYES